MGHGWGIYERDDSVQILPEADIFDHERDGTDCLCGPVVSYAGRVPLVKHASLDGREKHEAKHA